MPIPSEFTGFVHDVAKRAFDTLATEVKEIDAPLRGILRSWNKLSDSDKDLLIDALIASATKGQQAAPDKARKKSAVKKRATRSTRPSSS